MFIIKVDSLFLIWKYVYLLLFVHVENWLVVLNDMNGCKTPLIA
jgi:hypothetical protein